VIGLLLALLVVAVAGGLIHLPSHPPIARNGLVAFALDGTAGQEIHLLRADGTNERTVIGSDPRFSNDGTSLAFYASGDHGLTTVASADGQTISVLPLPDRLDGVARTAFAVSPGGEYVARVFTSAYHARDQVWVEAVADGSMWRTMSNYRTALQPGPLVWSPDGRRLAVSVTLSPFVSDVPYLSSIDSYTISPNPAATSDVDSVFGGAAPGFVEQGLASRFGPPDSPISWFPQSTAIAFAGYPQTITVKVTENYSEYVPTADISADIYVVRLSDGAEFNITQSAAHETNPEWAPDRSAIAYLQSDGTTTRIATVAMDGVRVIGEPVVGPMAEEFEWAPDASQLLAVHSDGTTSTVFLVDPQFRSAPTPLVSLGYPISSLSWQRLPP